MENKEPLILSDMQKKDVEIAKKKELEEKQKELKVKLEKFLSENDMELLSYLDMSPFGIIPKVSVIPKPKENVRKSEFK